MKGKSKFTCTEADAIIALIRLKLKANSQYQKHIRDKIRALGFYASDFGIGGGYTEHDFLRVVTIIGPPNPKIILQNEESKMDLDKGSVDEVIKSFSPISQPDAKLLILGTMPGERSMKLLEYYGHGGNHFWKIMFTCLNEPYSEVYADKINLLHKHKIALWDVLKHCEREGSADNYISREVPNDFSNFFKKHQNIKAILFNGQNAADYFNQYVGNQNRMYTEVLPSTSPANTWSTKEEKLKVWGQALNSILFK